MGYVQKSKFSKDTNKDNIVKDITHLIEFTEDLETQIDGQNQFSELQDVDVTYTGNAGKVIAINGTEDGVEAITISTVNLYNADDSLKGNRTVTGGGFSLRFDTDLAINIAPTVNSKLRIYQNNGSANDALRLDSDGNADGITIAATNGRAVVASTTNGFAGVFNSTNSSAIEAVNTNSVNYAIRAIGNTNGASGKALKAFGETTIVSPSASALDTAFSVRNNTDTSNHFYVRGDGRIFAIQTLEAVQGINISSGNLNFGASNFILSGTTGTVEMQAYNSNTIKLNPIVNDVWITSHNKFYSGGGINFPSVQVGNAGLSSGDLYFDTAANILANGDLVCGRKV